MRKFIVNVNGNSYEVEVEEMSSVPTQAAETKKSAPAPQNAKAPAGGTQVTAPMPGTIKKVAVKNGDTVKKNDVIFILEAMKLENEIYAPCDGKIASVNTSEGSSVNPGDVLCTIA